MTDKGHLNRRMRIWRDRIVWGFVDCQRMLVEGGFWPVATQGLVSPEGERKTLIGTRLHAAGSGDKAVGLLIPEAQCLWGTLQLPEMPQQALDTAVSEAMWRVSPLPIEHIMTAWRAVPNDDGSWWVEWGICHKNVQQDAKVRHGLGEFAPVYLERQGHALGVPSKGLQGLRKKQRRMDGLVAAGLFLSMAAVALPALLPLVLKREAVLQALQHTSKSEEAAAPLRVQLEELRARMTVADGLRQGQQSSVSLAAVVEALSAQLPDDTSLDRLEISASDIRISGITGDVADLTAQLARHAEFADVRANGASVRDTTTNKERFTFDMRWRGQGDKP